MATKQQEHKALEQIRKIVAGLGENSYVGTALEGCLQGAENNIESDAAYSMKKRYEKEQEDKEYFKDAANRFSLENEALRQENETIKQNVIAPHDLGEIFQLIAEKRLELNVKIQEAAKKIVESAEQPEEKTFRQAVTQHRNSKTYYETYSAISERLKEIYQ